MTVTHTGASKGRIATRAVVLALAAVVLLAMLVLLTRWLISLPAVAGFLERYPGTVPLPEEAPVGLPAWLGWQHFLNMFFIVLIIRSGWLIRTTKRPAAYWTRDNSSFPRTRGKPTKISLDTWVHLSLDAVWMVNGAVFVVLAALTGHWMRIVPTTWEVFPHAVSTGLQYLSLDWPVENGWVNYNALQMLMYFVTIFVAAPLAAISGFRMSPAWSARWRRAGRILPLTVARKIHFPVMVYFVLFIVAHVTLVLATGALQNLNHMYAARDEVSWVGFWYFAASLAVVIIGWVLSRAMFVQPVASLTGKVTAR